MSVWETAVIAVGVSIDALAVSVSAALCDRRRPGRYALLAAVFFGSFQFMMPLAGFFLGAMLLDAVQSFDHWIAFGLLSLVGMKMIREALCPAEGNQCKPAPFGSKNLLVLSVATSLDALAVGASLAMIKTPILIPALAMGVTTALISALGVLFGCTLGRAVRGERFFPLFGGLALIGIGVKILAAHLTQ